MTNATNGNLVLVSSETDGKAVIPEPSNEQLVAFITPILPELLKKRGIPEEVIQFGIEALLEMPAVHELAVTFWRSEEAKKLMVKDLVAELQSKMRQPKLSEPVAVPNPTPVALEIAPPSTPIPAPVAEFIQPQPTARISPRPVLLERRASQGLIPKPRPAPPTEPVDRLVAFKTKLWEEYKLHFPEWMYGGDWEFAAGSRMWLIKAIEKARPMVKDERTSETHRNALQDFMKFLQRHIDAVNDVLEKFYRGDRTMHASDEKIDEVKLRLMGDSELGKIFEIPDDPALVEAAQREENERKVAEEQERREKNERKANENAVNHARIIAFLLTVDYFAAMTEDGREKIAKSILKKFGHEDVVIDMFEAKAVGLLLEAHGKRNKGDTKSEAEAEGFVTAAFAFGEAVGYTKTDLVDLVNIKLKDQKDQQIKAFANTPEGIAQAKSKAQREAERKAIQAKRNKRQNEGSKKKHQ